MGGRWWVCGQRTHTNMLLYIQKQYICFFFSLSWKNLKAAKRGMQMRCTSSPPVQSCRHLSVSVRAAGSCTLQQSTSLPACVQVCSQHASAWNVRLLCCTCWRIFLPPYTNLESCHSLHTCRDLPPGCFWRGAGRRPRTEGKENHAIPHQRRQI